ncbi:MAG: 2-hydroxychromene-2-carboxylate isomerase [Alphaproteobacteria bacterium]|nr:2-hydroxychromene-2-carboxylate isomerase [Alphaproteobacteria bacterium]
MKLEFWFEFASSYSYVAVMRIEKIAAARNIVLEWRPFLLGPLFEAQQGLKDSPFNAVPVKGAYMWRDLERLCEKHGLPFQRPSRFPQNGLLAARIALSLPHDDRPNFVKAVFQANFVHDRDIADLGILHGALRRAGLDPYQTLEHVQSEEVKARLRDDTAHAADLGIFGAPTFATLDREIFWGNDRLEDALDWTVRLSPSGSHS